MTWAKDILRMGPAWGTAVLVTTVIGSIIQSWQVQSGLAGRDILIPSDLAVETALREFTGLAVPVLTVFGLALALGFAATSWLKPRLPLLAPIAWPLAGAAVIGTTLGFIHARLQISPLAGDRALDGFVLFCSAGALGGFIFAWLKPSSRT
jgi:hypothetical protein